MFHLISKQVLQRFAFDRRNADFCLAHLFTYRRFQDGILGLAYTAPSTAKATKEGGICAEKLWVDRDGYKGYLMLNTGMDGWIVKFSLA